MCQSVYREFVSFARVEMKAVYLSHLQECDSDVSQCNLSLESR